MGIKLHRGFESRPLRLRLPNSEHQARSWRIDEVAPDFRLEDVWALPVEGAREDFARLLAVMGSVGLSDGKSRATRLLVAVRLRLGSWLGWDDRAGQLLIPGDAETTLSARLPDDLRGTATDPGLGSWGFTPLYGTDLEWAAELSNKTVHAVLQLAWVPQGEDRYRGRLAVYVKPRGRLGAGYMALIAPFRHLVVYPALMRQIEAAWNDPTGLRGL
jgi:hypothetical protein